MQETPMLFPMTPSEFWKQIRITMEEVVTEKLNKQITTYTHSHLPEKALLKAADVCTIFQVSKPTLYEWLKQKDLKVLRLSREDIFQEKISKLL